MNAKSLKGNVESPPCMFVTGEHDDADHVRQTSCEFVMPAGLKVIEDTSHLFLEKQVLFYQPRDMADAFFRQTLLEKF